MICTAAASLSRRRLRSVAPLSLFALASRSQSTQRRQAEVLTVGGLVQQLRQVRQIGHLPLAVAATTAPGRAMPAIVRGLEDGRDAALAGVVGPLPHRLGDAVGQRVTPGGKVSAVSPKNIVVAAARTSPGRCGWSNASSRHSQSSAASEREDVGVAGVDGRDARRRSARRSRRGRPCASRRSRRCRRPRPALPSKVAPLASSAPTSAARSAGCVRAVRRSG